MFAVRANTPKVTDEPGTVAVQAALAVVGVAAVVAVPADDDPVVVGVATPPVVALVVAAALVAVAESSSSSPHAATIMATAATIVTTNRRGRRERWSIDSPRVLGLACSRGLDPEGRHHGRPPQPATDGRAVPVRLVDG